MRKDLLAFVLFFIFDKESYSFLNFKIIGRDWCGSGGHYSIHYKFQDQNYSSFTVNNIKTNQSTTYDRDYIYKEIQNKKPND